LRDNANLTFALRKVKDRLERAGVCWAVFAGAAAHCYGSKRKVTDIDILVKSADLEKAKAVLRNIEFVDVVADLEIVVDGETCLFFMDEEMEEKIQFRKLFGVEVPVVPVEDNIVFKAILQRTENQGKHDIEDICCMMKNEKIDIKYLRKRVRKYHAEMRVKPFLAGLGIL
jgi:hypothetical protein